MSASTVRPSAAGAAGEGGAAPAVPGAPPRGLRTDIQGLRALAVSLVVVYHLLPDRLRGGFVGVDVFFVISGFLITLHLVQRPPTDVGGLVEFWGRRVRRLLPASLLVLGTTLVLSRLLAPETQWAATARQARGATFYVVNWLLAGDAVDYLAAENAPSPVQHFWSLSVEEQFYLVWPVLVLVLVLGARRLGSPRDLTVLGGLGLVTLGSLGYSVWETSRDPLAAYFLTPTRVWELGVGGLLAVVVGARRKRGLPPLLPPGARSVLAWVGLAGIAWTALTYTAATPFPGWRALLPVLATALALGAHTPDARLSPGPLLARRPVQWLGDVSYSVYLWHWPLVVLIPQARHHTLDALDRVLVVVLTLLLAGWTKRHVEDRFRDARWGRPRRRPFVLAAAGMAVVVALTLAQDLEVDRREQAAGAALARATAAGGPCFGAAALDGPAGRCPPVPVDRVVPSPVDAATDKSEAYADVGSRNCFSYLPRFPQVRCTFGDPDAAVRVALVGNSHAGQWLPALQVLAREHDWRIDTYLASQCALAQTDQALSTPAQTRACSTWTRRTTRAVVRSDPDLVVYTNRLSVSAVGTGLSGSLPLYADGMTAVLRAWSRASLRVLVLHDTPAPGDSVPDCLALHPDDPTSCDGTRAAWIGPEPAREAVRRVGDPEVRFVDLSDHICGPRVCAAVTGGVVTYFDGSHLTATFAKTLAPYLDAPLGSLLGQGKRRN